MEEEKKTTPPLNIDETSSPESTPETQPTTPQDDLAWQQNRLDLSILTDAHSQVKTEVSKVIVGQDDFVEFLLIAILAGGHVLVEGVPGIAKTMTAKLMAQTLDAPFSRIQFTPDLMPSDVLGTTVYNMKTSEFSFKQGPIFSNIILIDEINRAPAKTQAALFEVMEEKQVTIDGITYPFAFPFFVIATQNPIEQEGTYKLPEAQLDRFLFKIKLSYPSLSEEKAILYRFAEDFNMQIIDKVQTVLSAQRLKECTLLVEKVQIKQDLLDYIASIVHKTRNHNHLFLGASPRASLAIMKAAKVTAALRGRDFVTPDDIQYVAYPVLNHRVILTPEQEINGRQTQEVINSILKQIEVPR